MRRPAPRELRQLPRGQPTRVFRRQRLRRGVHRPRGVGDRTLPDQRAPRGRCTGVACGRRRDPLGCVPRRLPGRARRRHRTLDRARDRRRDGPRSPALGAVPEPAGVVGRADAPPEAAARAPGGRPACPPHQRRRSRTTWRGARGVCRHPAGSAVLHRARRRAARRRHRQPGRAALRRSCPRPRLAGRKRAARHQGGPTLRARAARWARRPASVSAAGRRAPRRRSPRACA